MGWRVSLSVWLKVCFMKYNVDLVPKTVVFVNKKMILLNVICFVCIVLVFHIISRKRTSYFSRLLLTFLSAFFLVMLFSYYQRLIMRNWDRGSDSSFVWIYICELCTCLFRFSCLDQLYLTPTDTLQKVRKKLRLIAILCC